MSLAASESMSSVLEEPPKTSRRWLLVLGGLGAVSVVFAALVIFSSVTATTPQSDPVAPLSASSGALIVGASSAATKIVVYEDFGSQESRSFEISSRDFLRGEAAQGNVVVEYHPVTPGRDAYSLGALSAWRVVAERGTPAQALALHDLLFDKQPTAVGPAPHEFIALAKRAGVKGGALLDAVGAAEQAPAAGPADGAPDARTTLRVLVDGTWLKATSPIALADRLQRLILERTSAP